MPNKITLATPIHGIFKLPAGIYITIVPTENASTIEPEVYIRMAAYTETGERLPIEFGHSLKGEAFLNFVQTFQVMEQPLLQWLIDNGYEDGTVEPL